jgi:hypothetical protein
VSGSAAAGVAGVDVAGAAGVYAAEPNAAAAAAAAGNGDGVSEQQQQQQSDAHVSAGLTDSSSKGNPINSSSSSKPIGDTSSSSRCGVPACCLALAQSALAAAEAVVCDLAQQTGSVTTLQWQLDRSMGRLEQQVRVWLSPLHAVLSCY